MKHDVTSISSDTWRLENIQHASRHGRVLLTRHAEHAIRSATRAVAEGDKVRLEGGTDLDGDALVVVVREIQCGLKVITVF
jgi:hypothetical protein